MTGNHITCGNCLQQWKVTIDLRLINKGDQENDLYISEVRDEQIERFRKKYIQCNSQSIIAEINNIDIDFKARSGELLHKMGERLELHRTHLTALSDNVAKSVELSLSDLTSVFIQVLWLNESVHLNGIK